jgi:NAD(P)-dependent dehydrogenase (short-subunit alcohol dehydrogenase family)
LQSNVNGAEDVSRRGLNLTTAEGVATLIAETPETNTLVNNLAIYESKNFADIMDEEWSRLFKINVLGGIRLSRLDFPGMLAKNSGRVIFISAMTFIKSTHCRSWLRCPRQSSA